MRYALAVLLLCALSTLPAEDIFKNAKVGAWVLSCEFVGSYVLTAKLESPQTTTPNAPAMSVTIKSTDKSFGAAALRLSNGVAQVAGEEGATAVLKGAEELLEKSGHKSK